MSRDAREALEDREDKYRSSFVVVAVFALIVMMS